ncbi:MAG: VWD domain-containing protein, partial [Micromonosporaceae bacterium]
MRHFARIAVVFCLAVLGGVWLPQSASAKPADQPISLALSAPKTAVSAGDPVTLNATVTNRGDGSCATPDGTIQIISVTRDGEPVRPDFFHAGYANSYAAHLDANLKPAKPGKAVTFPLTERSRLTSVTPTPTGNGVGATWRLDQPGEYVIKASYRMPYVEGGCVGGSNTATLRLTATRLRMTSGGNWPLLGAAAAAVVLVGALAVILIRRRRTSAATALLLLAVVPLPLLGADPAQASITIDPVPAGFADAVNGCLGQLRQHDPAGIMKDLDNGKYEVTIYHTTGQGNVKAHTYPDHADITWDQQDHSPYEGDIGPAYDPCPALYHELVHSYDRQHKQLFPSPCPAGKRGQQPSIADVRAIRAENAVRAAIGSSDAGKLARNSAGRNSRGPLTLPAGDKFGVDDVLKDCKTDRKRTPPNKKGAIGSGLVTGGSDGDPHLTTFDQRRYDFQAVGEFVLAKSGDLEVQARQAAVEGSRLVSVNSALGRRVGSDRLSFALGADGLRIQLNGEPTSFDAAKTSLPGGGTVTLHDAEHTVTWPDGSHADVFPIGHWGLRILIHPASRRKGTLSGLLGDYDGDPANDLRTAGDRPLSDTPTHKQLYGDFADRWRVTHAGSLLPYPKGRDTRSYTDKTFPDRPGTGGGPSPEARRAAREICTSLGIVEPARLADCELDVAVTGQPALAATAAITDQLT